MAENSRIEWTDTTWNPIAGCSKVSAGCKHCYAETMAKRLVAMGQAKYAGTVDEKGRWTGRINFDEKALIAPLKWRKPRMVFVNSMSDLFHESVPFEFIDRVFAVMALCPSQTFQVLTKRPGRMLEYLTRPFPSLAPGLRGMAYKIHDCTIEIAREVGISNIADWDICPAFPTGQAWPLPNVWLGASVENQEQADARIPKLLACPASVRFLSCEPLLGAVDLHHLQNSDLATEIDCLKGTHGVIRPHGGTCGRIDWVICGGESGPNARPMHPDWARGLRDQCQTADVPFFFKQWGEWVPGENNDGPQIKTERVASLWNDQWHFYEITPEDGENLHCDDEPDVWRFGKKAAGRHLDGREWNEVPEVNHG